MNNRLAFILAAAAVLGGAFAAEERIENQILPLRTIRFPGGGIGHGVTAGRLFCASSGWSREDGAQLFDISDPSRIRLVGRVGARGYAVAPPVLLGGYAIYPNLASVSILDITKPESPRHVCLLARSAGSAVRVAGRFIVTQGGDGVRLHRLDGRAPKARPVWIGFLPEQPLAGFPVSEQAFTTVSGAGTNRLWRTYELTDSGFSLKTESSVELKSAPATPDLRLAAFPANSGPRCAFSGQHAFLFDTSRPSISSYEVKGTNALFLGERFFLHALGTVAAKDNTAYVYAPGTRRTVLTLDAATNGVACRDFSAGLVSAALARTNTFMTIGMQTGGAISRSGGILFCDDGLARIGADGGLAPVRDPVLAVANHAFDGQRVALAQSRRCRVLDYSRFPDVKTVVDFAPTGLVHITGCALKGDRLFVTWLPKSRPNHDFIYQQPARGFFASVDLKRAKEGCMTEAESVLEISAAVTCLLVGDRYLYVPGYRGVFTVIDAGDPAQLKIVAERDDLLTGGSYKIKAAGSRVFCQNGGSILELDVSQPEAPQIARVFVRGEPGAPSYDDFTVDGDRLYALAHASLDVFDLDGAAQRVARPAPAREVNVVEARLPVADPAPAMAPSPVDTRTATVVYPAANLVFFTVAPAGKGACGYLIAAKVSEPTAPKCVSVVPCAERILALAIDPAARRLYAADGRSVLAFAYSAAGVLTPAGSVTVSEDFVRGPQGLAVAGDGRLIAACGASGLYAVDVQGGTATPLDGGSALKRIFVANVASDGRKLYLACDAAGFATAELAESGTKLSRVKLTPVPAGNITALAVRGKDIFAAAGLEILYACREVGTPSAAVRGGRFANYFSAFGLGVALAGEVVAVADGEGGMLLYDATARDAHGAPAYLGELPHASGGGPFAFGSSLAAVPGRVYLNDPGAGLRIIDISDPANVRLLACLKPVK